MKAISLWQPWASLMAFQEKRNETRSWETKYRGPLAIHATATWKKEAELASLHRVFKDALAKHGCYDPKLQLPFGAILGYCELTDCIPVEKYLQNHSVKYQELKFGDYSENRYIWTTKWINTFEKPIAAKGAQQLWNWDHLKQIA